MRTFQNQAAQGDLYIRRVDSIPAGLKKMGAENGRYIVAHSETSHHHVIEARPNVTVFTTNDPLVSYLQVIEATDAMEVVIEHLRNFDTHESIKVGSGNYEIRRQREYTPEGWRRVAD
jgi:aminoglycoside N3'-acetyltransferase